MNARKENKKLRGNDPMEDAEDEEVGKVLDMD